MKEKTYEMLEKALQEKIGLIDNNNNGGAGYYDVINDVKTLSEILTNIDKVEYDHEEKMKRVMIDDKKVDDEIFDRSERRQLDQKKIVSDVVEKEERRRIDEKRIDEEIIDKSEIRRIDEKRVDDEIFDRSERRRIDEEKNKEMAQIEREKQNLTWKKVGMEMIKVFGPLGISMFGYNIFQKRVIKFEETGRLVTTASRELHLPKFFK